MAGWTICLRKYSKGHVLRQQDRETLCIHYDLRKWLPHIPSLSLCALLSKTQQNPCGIFLGSTRDAGPCSELSGPKPAKGVHVTISTHRWETDAPVCSTTSFISSKAEGSHREMKKHKGRREEERGRKRGRRGRETET